MMYILFEDNKKFKVPIIVYRVARESITCLPPVIGPKLQPLYVQPIAICVHDNLLEAGAINRTWTE